MNSKDTSVIPKGFYCHGKMVKKDGKRTFPNMCPYWSIDRARPEQENGYCSYLEKGDWDLNLEGELIRLDPKTSEPLEVISEKGEESPFPISLLWDCCKECNIKMDYPEELEDM